MKSFRERRMKMVRAALLAAVLAVLSQLSVPTPSAVPVTLQIFGVALCGACLGTAWGSVAVLVYLLLGAVGVPVFSAFGGGISVLLSPTGGFLVGFPVLAICVGAGCRGNKKASGILWTAFGLTVCHLLGSVWFSFVGDCSLWQALITVSLPYLIKDALLVWGAVKTAHALRHRGIF